MTTSRITAAQFELLVGEQMGIDRVDFPWSVARIAHGEIEIRLEYSPRFARPGGTISGPTMFTLADLALYGAVLSACGLIPLAVTTDMTIHFLRRPPPFALLGHAKVLKAGSKLMMGSVHIYGGEGEPTELVCHAAGTYAVPPSRSAKR